MFWELFSLQHMRKCGNFSVFIALALTELPNTDYGFLLRRRGPLQPIRMCRNDVS